MNTTETQTPATGSIYTRGTATQKITSARVRVGTLLLTEADPYTPGSAIRDIATSKSGRVWREVSSVVKGPMGSRSQSRYFIAFTDGAAGPHCAPSQTWMTPAN